ncbi:MAG: hypothetical protein Q8O88_02045 [bacterium]|nr:hypothetical protein [bacterium]
MKNTNSKNVIPDDPTVIPSLTGNPELDPRIREDDKQSVEDDIGDREDDVSSFDIRIFEF